MIHPKLVTKMVKPYQNQAQLRPLQLIGNNFSIFMSFNPLIPDTWLSSFQPFFPLKMVFHNFLLPTLKCKMGRKYELIAHEFMLVKNQSPGGASGCLAKVSLAVSQRPVLLVVNMRIYKSI